MSKLFAHHFYAGTILLMTLCKLTDCLSCYTCPQTTDITGTDANTQCLEKSGEITCSVEEDRCFSLTTGTNQNTVEKNCARSTDCVGRICCDSEFCNAGLGITPQRGHGKVCDTQADCVQGTNDMRCQPERSSATRKRCLCTDTRVAFGAICRKAFINERCSTDGQCSDTNSVCLSGRCVCKESFYANQTFCQAKRKLREPCSTDYQCEFVNSECDGYRCVCRFGFLHSNTTKTCSDGESVHLSVVLRTIVLGLTLITMIGNR